MSRADMPLAFITSATTRNIRITTSSVPPERPIAVWVVRKGKSGSAPNGIEARGPRKSIVARIPTMESMKTIGVPARVRATKITPSGTSWDDPDGQQPAADRPQRRRRSRAPPDQAGDAVAGPGAPRPASRAAHPRAHRRQVVQGDEVVADGHRGDRVEPRAAPSER